MLKCSSQKTLISVLRTLKKHGTMQGNSIGDSKGMAREICDFSNRSRIVELPRTRVQDIDTPEDWHRAELMAQLLLDV